MGEFVFKGGPLDYASVPAARVTVADGEGMPFYGADDIHTAHVYRRDGNSLVFVESQAVVRFHGGPYDGMIRPRTAYKCSTDEKIVIPYGNNSNYAWYEWDGKDATFVGATPVSEMEVVDE